MTVADSFARRGFTLVEVLMAAFILSLLATGALATTWRLAGFARNKASELAAENFCSDIAMSYLSQDLSLLVDPTKPVLKKTFATSERETCRLFPRFRGKDFLGETKTVVPFWRDGYKNPTLTVWVTNTTAAVGTRVISVSLDWGIQGSSDFPVASFTLEQGQ